MHGGPHACDVNQYSRLFHLLLLRRFAILSINYGGSIGFGRAGVEALYGCAGDADVRDCIAAVQSTIAAARVRADVPLCVQGGSHGGFLTLHLLAAEPSLFAAAAVRNPVTNIASMRHTTDIGDWCEAMTCGGAAGMRQASPIAGVHRVRTPTLMAIGSKDQRVPAFQGREWLNALREANPAVQTTLLEFPDCGHALDSPAAEAEFAVASCAFFEQHCFQTKKSA
jgi:acylaminoacyl-peptidase